MRRHHKHMREKNVEDVVGSMRECTMVLEMARMKSQPKGGQMRQVGVVWAEESEYEEVVAAGGKDEQPGKVCNVGAVEVDG
jgi:hypothetical protein